MRVLKAWRPWAVPTMCVSILLGSTLTPPPLAPAAAIAAAPAGRFAAPPVDGDGDGAAANRERYIVQLADPPLAEHLASPATTPPDDARADASGRARLDLAAPAAAAYRALLAHRQAELEARLAHIAPGTAAQYHYHVAFNGIALPLTSAEATAVAALPGVKAVSPVEKIVPLMDTSLGQIHAPAAWEDPRVGGRANAGRGVRIAVIDSGITASHPFFADAGFAAPPGFPKASLTVGDRVTPYAAADVARFTNNKVIVARAYANPEVFDAANPPTPLADGFGGFHGAHVAGTAAGIETRGAPGGGTGSLPLSGVAPGAYLMAYKFTNAYTPEILRMIDDAVSDGADVINNSWGTSAMNVMDPDRHPVAQAFKAATAAGVIVVAAAGNAGTNGEATLGGPHQMIDEVITVANVQTGRSFAYYLYASDADLPTELEKHPTVYQGFGKSWDVIEAPVFKNDLCNPLSLALGARGKVVLAPIEGACPTSVLPIPLPEQLAFVNKLINAALANAAGDIVGSVVFYSPTGSPQLYGQALQLIETLKPLLQQFLPSTNFPVTAVITGDEAMQLTAWADTHRTLRLRLENTPASISDPTLVDAVHPTSSQGPAPQPGGPLKPDLSAPGTDILSTNVAADGSPNGYTTATGTSMASPHVAGAAAVVRQAWPGWPPADIKAALMITADPVATVGGAGAPLSVQGSGRLDLAQAIDPGLLVLPPSINLGRRGPGGRRSVQLRLKDVRQAPAGDVTYTMRDEPAEGQPENQVFRLAGTTVTLRAGGSGDINTLAFFDGLAPGVHEGRIVFESAAHTVRVAYRVEIVGDQTDVLLLDVRRTAAGGAPPPIPGLPGGGTLTDGPDYAPYWTQALESAGLSHDTWTVAEGAQSGTPPLSVLQKYDLVIVAAGDGNAPLDQTAGGMTALQMYLLGGGRVLVSGHNYPHAAGNALGIQGSGAMYFLSRYFGGFERTRDDAPAPTALSPVRLFDRPVALSASTSADAAGNGATLDLGRPLAKIQTAAGQQLAPDIGLAAPMVVDRVMPYMRTYLAAGGDAAMTGVTPDATLEQPTRADFIPWRALFAGFAIEAVTPGEGHLTRADLLKRVHQWAIEPDDLVLSVTGPAALDTGAEAVFSASATSTSGGRAVAWRWDAGDGRSFVTTAEPTIAFTYARAGAFTVRAEATTAGGHTWVASHAVTVAGPGRIFVPITVRAAAPGSGAIR